MSCTVCVEGAPGFCDCGPEPVECPACEGRRYVNGNQCKICFGHGIMSPSDADLFIEDMENEAADFASLEASFADLPPY